MNELIKLITDVGEPDEYGDHVPDEIVVERFAEVKSVSQTEFHQANAYGLKPEIKFVLADFYDYNDQKVVEYNGKRYQVYRVFRAGKRLEINCYAAVNNG